METKNLKSFEKQENDSKNGVDAFMSSENVMGIMDLPVTYYDNLYNSDSPKQIKLIKFIEDIKNPPKEIIKKINTIRNLKKGGEKNKEKIDSLKRTLPAYNITGSFNYRKILGLKYPNGLAIIDFDNIEYENIDKIMKYLSSNKYVLCYFLSPSGNGIKIIIRIPHTADVNINWKQYIEKYIEDYKKYIYGFIENHSELEPYFDENAKDIARLCFISYDPNIYVNVNAEIWCKKSESFDDIISIETLSDKHNTIIHNNGCTLRTDLHTPSYDILEIRDVRRKLQIIEKIIEKEGKGKQYVIGNRNNYVFNFACCCSECGIDMNDTIEYVFTEKDPAIDENRKNELIRTIRSAYDRTRLKFGSVKLLDYKVLSFIKDNVNKFVSQNNIDILQINSDFCNSEDVNNFVKDLNKLIKKNYGFDVNESLLLDIVFNEIQSDNLKLNIFTLIKITKALNGKNIYKFQFNVYEFYKFLQRLIGLHIYKMDDDGKGEDKYGIVIIKNNLVVPVESVFDIRLFVTKFFEYLNTYWGINKIDDIPIIDILESFNQKNNLIFNDSIITNFKYVDLDKKLIRSDDKRMVLLFNNCVVYYYFDEDRVEIVDLDKLDGLIWDESYELSFECDNVMKSSRLKLTDIDYIKKKTYKNSKLVPYIRFHNFRYDPESAFRSKFRRFCQLCTDYPGEQLLLESAIGFLCYDYKSYSQQFGIMFIDKLFDENKLLNNNVPRTKTAKGGRGKGLILQAISHVQKTLPINGKQNIGEFTFQSVNKHIKVVHINDLNVNENVEVVYNFVTDEFISNRKYKNHVCLTFEDSPKVCITSNLPIDDVEYSTTRRFIEVRINDYFKRKSIKEEFNIRFFQEFTDEDWNEFYNYILYCIKLGKKLDVNEKLEVTESDLYSKLTRVNDKIRDFIENGIEDNLYFNGKPLSCYKDMLKYEVKYDEQNRCLKVYKLIKTNYYSTQTLYKAFFDFMNSKYGIHINDITREKKTNINIIDVNLTSASSINNHINQYIDLLQNEKEYFKKLFPDFEIVKDEVRLKYPCNYILKMVDLVTVCDEEAFDEKFLNRISKCFNREKNKYIINDNDLKIAYLDFYEHYEKYKSILQNLKDDNSNFDDINIDIISNSQSNVRLNVDTIKNFRPKVYSYMNYIVYLGNIPVVTKEQGDNIIVEIDERYLKDGNCELYNKCKNEVDEKIRKINNSIN